MSVLTRFLHVSLIGLLICQNISAASKNLTCYQCIRKTNDECDPQDLKPCPEVADRCVTHLAKNVQEGFSIKRECGLGPCGFDDDMVNRGLGMNQCDRSRREYFCILCCRESGCNKNAAKTLQKLTLFSLLTLVALNYKLT